jgi:uncharacterized protein (TIGR00299 family) protein
VDLYLEPVGGISGDMLLGALIGLGADAEMVFRPILDAGVKFDWRVEKARRGAVEAAHVRIDSRDDQRRGLAEILGIVRRIKVPGSVRDSAVEGFRALAEAEAGIHGVSVNKIHFHELGAVDTIVDVVGGLYACHMLGIDEVYTAPVPLGSGWVDSAHGRLPIPAPATVRLIEAFPGIPVAMGDGRTGELTTPTGALMLRTLRAKPIPAASFVFRKTSYSAGTRDEKDFPNVLRASLVEAARTDTAPSEVVRMETSIDNMTGEALGFLRERLEEAGALEVGYIAQGMKKGRPGVLVTILTSSADAPAVRKALFRHSTTIGVRWWPVWREVLARETVKVKTPFGPVAAKKTARDGRVRFSVEYEDAARLAREAGVSVMDVIDAANAMFQGASGLVKRKGRKQ